jgi:hypothetical protein
MIEGSFVEALSEELRAPQVVTVNGVERLVIPGTSTEGWKTVTLPQPEHLAPTLKVGTLDGFASYIRDNRDSLDRKTLLAHVVDPGRVDLLGPVVGDFRQRATLASADLSAFNAPKFQFGSWHDMETFIIGLQAHFVPTPTLADVLKLIGNVKDEAVRQTTDDGVTQSVVAKQGAVLVAEVPVPNPVELAPYRTFREVEQPESRFLLRLRSGGPTCALFEADGGAWKLEAVAEVKAWLVKALETTGVTTIA